MTITFADVEREFRVLVDAYTAAGITTTYTDDTATFRAWEARHPQGSETLNLLAREARRGEASQAWYETAVHERQQWLREHAISVTLSPDALAMSRTDDYGKPCFRLFWVSPVGGGHFDAIWLGRTRAAAYYSLRGMAHGIFTLLNHQREAVTV